MATLLDALKAGLEIADLDVTLSVGSVDLDVPAFYAMSDARECAMLLHAQFGIQLYAREYTLAGTAVYVVY